MNSRRRRRSSSSARADSQEPGRDNGLIIRHGYMVARVRRNQDVAPTYSVAKSMLATVAALRSEIA